MPSPKALLVGLIGVVAGFSAGWWGRELARVPESIAAAPDAAATAERDDAAGPRELEPLSSPSPPAERSPVAETGAERRELDPLFSNALLERARAGILAGWGRERPDRPTDEELEEGLERFRELCVEAVPIEIGRELANRRSTLELAREDARRGGVLEALERLQEGGNGPLTALLLDGKTFDGFFVPTTSGPTLAGTGLLAPGTVRRDEPVPDGTVATFPAGVWSLADFGSSWRDHYPRDLTLRGAGMNATLLVLDSDLSAYDVVLNLVFEDCTVHADDNYLFDIRKPAMSLTLRRVRVTGWDMGAGGSCMFGTEALALRALDCEFLGGYGRSPQHGRLFDVRHDGLLARFDRCLVSRTRVSAGLRDGATVVFSHCRLEDLLDAPPLPGNVTLDGSSLTYWSDGPGGSLSRDLNDFFPNWKAELRR